MTLVVNLVKTVSSAKFICCCWRNACCDCHATHTPKCNESAKIRPNYSLWLNNTDCLSVYPVRITTQLRSGAVDKMAGIFTKRIWQPYICQPNEHGKLGKKTGGPNGGSSKNLGGPWPTQAPLESPLILPYAVWDLGRKMFTKSDFSHVRKSFGTAG